MGKFKNGKAGGKGEATIEMIKGGSDGERLNFEALIYGL